MPSVRAKERRPIQICYNNTYYNVANNPLSTPENIISLVQYSTPEQEFGTSETRQERNNLDFCRDMTWDEPNRKFDLGARSGWSKGQRRAAHRSSKTDLGQFYEDVQNNLIPPKTALLVEYIHRFGREQVQLAATDLFGLLNAGIMVYLTAPSKRLILFGIIPYEVIRELLDEMNFAEKESNNKSELISQTKQLHREATIENNQPFPGRLPGWLELKGYDPKRKSGSG